MERDDHYNQLGYLVGKIYIPDLYDEEANLVDDIYTKDKQKKKGEHLNIYLYKDERGNITKPHFHVKSTEKGVGDHAKHKIDACLYLYKPEYYSHNVHTDKLDNDILEALIKWLHEIRVETDNVSEKNNKLEIYNTFMDTIS